MNPEDIEIQDALAGEYSIERELGRGGMGVVYLAREVQLDRLVALKILPRALAARGDVREGFLREARLAARLSHPNIVAVHRVGEAAQLPYFSMEYVDGQTLGERLRDRGPVPSRLLSEIIRDIALALAYAHGRGVVHRDIKPDNILLEAATGRALLTDFGIAAAAGDRTPAHAAAGTAQFMSPEQLLGAPVDARSDIYSLGLVAAFAASGILPHEHGELPVLVQRRVSEDAYSLGAVVPEVPASLAEIVDRCTERLPENRFENAEALAAALSPRLERGMVNLPPTLRRWAYEPVPLMPLYGAWSITTVYAAVLFLAEPFYRGSVVWTAALAFAPLIPIGLFEAVRTRKALAEGFTLADLRLALRASRAESLAALDDETKAPEPRWTRWLRGSFPVILATSTLLTALGFGRMHFTVEAMDVEWWTRIAIWTARYGTWLGALPPVLLTVMGRPLLPPSFRRRWLGRIRDALWNGAFAERLIARLTPADRAIPAGDFRPTELALEIALGDLYRALPEEYRASLPALPETAQRLTLHGAQLREAIDRADAEGGDASALRGELARVVTALERLRLGLLRLHGGMTDLAPLTTTLDAAQLLADHSRRLADAQREVTGGAPIALERAVPTPV